ncbi:MAG: hypothetical protein EPO24_09855 [Bacteroidetes bacterium]|nr:MAG: hypothetical protein EPO24_09855 [Bacteroidota bacterium]
MKRNILMSVVVLTILFLAGCNNEETIIEPDVTYSIRSVYWTSRTDADRDGYATRGTLNLEIDAGSNVTRELAVRFFYKGANETTWTWLGDKTVTITGNRNDAILYQGVGSTYYYGLYDFRFIISAWSGSNLLYNAVLEPENTPALNDQKFEYDGEDLRFEP